MYIARFDNNIHHHYSLVPSFTPSVLSDFCVFFGDPLGPIRVLHDHECAVTEALGNLPMATPLKATPTSPVAIGCQQLLSETWSLVSPVP